MLDCAPGGVGPVLPQDNEVGDEEELVVDEEVVADVPTLKFPDILNHQNHCETPFVLPARTTTDVDGGVVNSNANRAVQRAIESRKSNSYYDRSITDLGEKSLDE